MAELAHKAAKGSRAKKRRSAPKSRSGCQTCKIRRVKCDETRPHCIRCVTAGWTCDGYPNRRNDQTATTQTLLPLRPATGSSKEPLNLELIAFKPPGRIEGGSSFPLKSPLPDFPGTANEHRSFKYFLTRTAPDLGLFSDDVFWNLVVTRIAFSEKPVLHALVAVAALHEDRLRAIDHEDPINHTFSLSQYTKAIHKLNDQISDDKQGYQITLLNCLLFGYFEFLRGSPDTALMHLHSGMKLLPSYNRRYTKSINTSDYGRVRNQTEEPLIDQELARTFSRFRVPALVRTPLSRTVWNPIKEYDLGIHCGKPFAGLHEAEDRLRPLVVYAFDPYGVVPKPMALGAAIDAEANLRQDVDRYLKDWTTQLGLFLADRSTFLTPEEIGVVWMLRLQSLVAKLWNLIGSSARQIDYDDHTSDFRLILSLIERLLGGDLHGTKDSLGFGKVEGFLDISSLSDKQLHQTNLREGSKLPDRQRLEFSVGLYFTATKCRSPKLRRQALAILQSRDHTNKTLPYSGIFSKIVQRVIDFEEHQCLQPVTEDPSSWPAEYMRIQRTYFLPIYDSEKTCQTAMFIWQPGGPGTEMQNWMQRFSF